MAAPPMIHPAFSGRRDTVEVRSLKQESEWVSGKFLLSGVSAVGAGSGHMSQCGLRKSTALRIGAISESPRLLNGPLSFLLPVPCAHGDVSLGRDPRDTGAGPSYALRVRCRAQAAEGQGRGCLGSSDGHEVKANLSGPWLLSMKLRAGTRGPGPPPTG